ncbi:MAG TPA: hypothetical protein ENJ32_13500 [Crenotrichaceae bacterium]|nr:hypothetical protein [Crenotrichaceae bacterium]
MRFLLSICSSLILAIVIKISIDSQLWKGNVAERLRLTIFPNTAETELTKRLNHFTAFIQLLHNNTGQINSNHWQQSKQDIALLVQKLNLRFEFVFNQLSKRRAMLARHFSKRILTRHDAFVASITEQHKHLNQLTRNISNSDDPDHLQKNLAALAHYLVLYQQEFNQLDSADIKKQHVVPTLKSSKTNHSASSAQPNLVDYLPNTPISKGKELAYANMQENNTAEQRIFSVYMDHCHLRYKPVHGALQNHDLRSLEHRIDSANAFDITSSMINNLRQLKIPARYVYGKIKVSESDLLFWLGRLDTLAEALALLKQGGIHYQLVNEREARKVVLLEHIWVEAWLDAPSENSRWIALDPSFNRCHQSVYWQPKTKLDSTVFSHAEQLAEKYIASVNIQAERFLSIDTNLFREFAQAAEKAEYQQINEALSQYQELTSSTDYIDPNENTDYVDHLPESLAYHVASVAFRSVQLPDSLRRSFQIRLTSTGKQSKHLIFKFKSFYDELIGKSVKFVFQPATPEDSELLNRFLGIKVKTGAEIDLTGLPESIPAYLIKVRPTLVVDQQVIATGKAVALGQTYHLQFFSQDRYGKINKTSSGIISGESISIHLHAGTTASVKQWLEVLTRNPSQILINTATSLSNLLTSVDQYQGNLSQAKITSYPGFLTVSTQLITNRWLGQTATVSFGGVQINTENMDFVPLSNDLEHTQQITDSLRIMASTASGQTLDYFLSNSSLPGKSISTLQVFKQALDQSVPIILLSKHNLPQLETLLFDRSFKLILRKHIESGENILIPITTLEIGEWIGTGYRISNPQNATSRYVVRQSNVPLKRLSSAMLINDMTRTLAATELIQNQSEELVFPKVYAQTNQSHNNLVINNTIAKLQLLLLRILNQTKIYKNENLDNFLSVIISKILDHTALYEKEYK